MSDNSVQKKIAKSAVIMTMVSAISLVFSFLQESIFAYYYGANLTTDAYTVAIQIPVTLFSLVSTAITTVVIPCYSKELYGKDKKTADRYASNLMTTICLFTCVLVVLGEIFAKYIIVVFAPGMDSATQLLATTLFRIVLPTIILTELMNINTGILNVHKSFVLPSLMSNILNITFVTCIAILADKYGIYAAIVGTVVGTCFEFLYSIALRRRFVKYRFILDLRDNAMVTSFKMAIPVFIGIGAAEINKLVDRMVSSFLQEGSISTLNYASKLSSAISSLLIYSISTVIYPEFAKNSAENNDKGMAEVFSFSVNLFVLIILPIIAGGMVLNKEIIKVVYGRGAFDLSTVERTAPLFSCYLVCLLFTTFRQTSSRVFYSYGDSKTPMKNSIVGIVINIILNVILGYFFGALGLALATTIATAVISLLLLKDVKRKNCCIDYKPVILLLGKVVLACGIMDIVIVCVKKIMVKMNYYNIENFLNTMFFIALAILIGVICYFIVLLLMKTKEVSSILNFIRRKKKL